MGNFLDKLKNMTNINEQDDYYEEDEYMEDEYEDFDDAYDEPVEAKARPVNNYSSATYEAKTNNIVNLKANVQLGMVIIHPRTYDDARSIADHIKSYRPVVINLDAVDSVLAQRIMDFVSGTCYTLRGDLQRVARNIFLIAPENVEITGDTREELKTRGINLPWKSMEE